MEVSVSVGWLVWYTVAATKDPLKLFHFKAKNSNSSITTLDANKWFLNVRKLKMYSFIYYLKQDALGTALQEPIKEKLHIQF